MKVFYSLGGLGNIYFQVVKAESLNSKYQFCDFFVGNLVRKLFKHTNHERIHNKLFSINYGGCIFLPLLFLDILVGKLLSKTFFSVLDTNFVQADPIFFDFLYFGYFQKNVSAMDYLFASKVIKPSVYNEDYQLCIHIRGGDFGGDTDNVATSKLKSDYYRKCYQLIKSDIEPIGKVAVVTNDEAYAIKIMKEIDCFDNVIYFFSDVVEDFSVIRSAKFVICSNSTFALMAALSSKKIEHLLLPSLLYNNINNISELNVRVYSVNA
jgi:hypothetical protein